ncbi:MAG: Eco57I restriction-modification methylase domain-containing protein [Aquificaceae bacterium]|nr:Eco57I restriction-modification methylase domain-containing protein [Aquificaceae bacterium]
MEMLIESLINQFSLKNLRKFFEEKLRIELKEEEDVLPREDYEEYFGKLYVLKPYGKENIKLKDDTIAIYAIESKKELSERSSKKRQFELAKRLLGFEDGGFFVFYDKKGNFRFSFVHKIYEGAKHKFSHYKRYTYFVQKGKPYRTFKEALLELQLDSIESITEAFAVQPLIKEFYKEIQNWYAWALKDNKVWFPGGTKEENLIRLITRLIFVWFLKEMKLVPEEIFDEERLKDIVKDFGEKDYYYNAILQNLFFATLNREIGKREFAKEGDFLQNRTHFGVKNLYRYQSFLKIPPEDFIKLFEKTPFINGGLFECLDEDSQYVDGFSREESKRAKIPDEFFFLVERTEDLSYFYGTNARREKVRGLINILKDYNFTADENSPVDVEVSLDPELLGHIFENLLASYNEETQTTAKKATGSYYTPKEIVDFMVEESLKEYLRTKTGIEEGSVEKLFGFEENVELSEEERHKILKAIDEIKVLDPAVGSGAFPMGVLHKLVYLLERIDPNNELWYELQYQKALKEAEDILRIENKDTREELLKELNENFDEAITYPDYARKLYILQNSIYGVDIQNIAIQITKLRFFLSLIIDQKPDPSKENLGIKPLPHLETNFITANTLIGLESQGQQRVLERVLESPKITQLKAELKKLYKKHFSIRSREEKKRIQDRAKAIREEIKQELERIGYSNDTAQKIAEFDIFDQLARADWFDPEWMFGIENFDIVIGNPPYVYTRGMTDDVRRKLEDFYGFVDDLYNHFYVRGIQLLKENGILAYISSKTFWTIQTKKNLRELLLENTILKLVDSANPFESSMVDTCITIVKKARPQENHKIQFIDARKGIKEGIIYTVEQNVYKQTPNQVIFIPTPYNMNIYDKILKKAKELLDNYWHMISTSKNIEKYKNVLEKYRQSLKPGDITLLGLITEGGQGLATGDNGRYIGVLEGTKWAEKVRRERPEKLLLADDFCKKQGIKNKRDAEEFLRGLSEKEIRKLFDSLKEEYGRDIFGQGWLYRIVSQEEIADVDSLTEDEKLNGIEGERTFVPYDKGDKDGNRWYAPTPYYIDWSRENVRRLQTDKRARWQGYQFYFREGFCWTNVLNPNARLIKCRLKEKSVNDVGSMSLSSVINVPNYYFVCILNSNLIFDLYRTFVNYSVNIQINDIRQLPIIIPTPEQLAEFENIFNRAYSIQKQKFEGKITEEEAEELLNEIQKELDEKVEKMYLGE